MKLNFKKIAAIAGTVLMTGASLGFAAAANYPAPFVSSGVGNVAIVTGTGAGVSALDTVQAGNIQASLSQSVTGGTVTNISGEAVPLDRGSSSRIYLNTSLTTAQSIYTKTDLPTVLADSTFSGDVSATVTQQVTLGSGLAAGGDNSGKVIFSKQPTSSVDPSVGLSIGTSQTNPIYNATVNFNNAIAFNNSQSQGQTLNLFGRDYTVSSDSSTTNGLVLFQSAQTVTLTQGGTAGADSATVTVDGSSHTVQLLNAGTSSATISVDGTSQSVNTGSSRTINGVSVAVTSVQSSTAGGNTATVLVGAKKLTFKAGQQVTSGDSNQAILGTYVYFGGTVDALTSLTVAVYAPDTSHDWVGNGDSFVDPVFGSFVITNSGLSSALTDASRDTIKVGASGSTTLTLSMTDKSGNDATFDWATNSSGNWNLSTSNGYNIYPYEMANLSLNDYTMTGTGSSNQNTGKMLQLQTVYNDTSTYTNDYVQFYDPISGDTLKTGTPTSEGSAPLTIDGRQYTVTYSGTAGSSTGANAQIKYPTSDSGTTDVVLFPTMLANNGESVELYAPQTLSLDAFNGTAHTNPVSNYKLPNGNGYTTVSVAYAGNASSVSDAWTINGNATKLETGTGGSASSVVNVAVGQLTYQFAGGSTANQTTVYLLQPGTATQVAEPGIVMFEGKDSNNNYQAVVVDTKADPAGTSSDGVGVNAVYFTGSTHYGSGTAGVQLYSNSNVQQYMDGFGTLVTKDSTSSSQPIASISYPSQQVYEQLYIGEAGSSVSSGGALGNVIVTDSNVASVSGKNLVIVGGSCINSAAATALGVPMGTCGDAFTSATGVGAGQFLIKGVQDAFSTGKLALVVAGYDAADTVNAATYLTHKTVDTSKTYVGTSGTEATLTTA